MSDALLLLPDFALIACGFLICRYTSLGSPVWDAAERLVYVLLFPALLFSAIVRNPMALGTALPLAASTVVVVGVGVLLAFALGALPGVDRRLHASGAQTAFHFNSYVALALSKRLAVTPGQAWMALVVSVRRRWHWRLRIAPPPNTFHSSFGSPPRAVSCTRTESTVSRTTG